MLLEKKFISLKLLLHFTKKLHLGTANLIRRLLSGVINIYMPLNVSGSVSSILWLFFFLFVVVSCKIGESILEEGEYFGFF